MTRSRSSRANLTYSMYFLLPTLSSNSFLTTLCFFFASSAILSFFRLLSYPIHQVCVSLDKLYCSWPGWLVASSLSTKNEKGSKAKFVAPIVFRPPEMCSLWMIDPRKEKERNSPPIFDHRDLTFFVF